MIKCKFCEFEVPAKADGKPAWGKLKAHVAKEHKDEAAKIQDGVSKIPTPRLATDARVFSRGGASTGREFRKRLGYGPGAVGGDDPKGDDD